MKKDKNKGESLWPDREAEQKITELIKEARKHLAKAGEKEKKIQGHVIG